MFDDLAKDGLVGPFNIENKTLLSRMVWDLDHAEEGFRNIHVRSRSCKHLLNAPELQEKIFEYFGQDLKLWRTNSFKKIDGSGEVAWHHDRHFEDGDQSINFDNLSNHFSILIALTDMDDSTGLMEFIPGSHLNQYEYQKDVRPYHRKHLTEHFLDLPESLTEKKVSVPLKRGQFMLFHSGLFHRSLPASGNSATRYSLVARLCLQNTQIPEELAQRPDILTYPIKLPSAGRFNGKVVLITGGSRGIGNAIAESFLIEGADVIITGRHQDALDAAVVKASKFSIMSRFRAIKADASNLDEMHKVFRQVHNDFGPIDILFVNAAVNAASGTLESIEPNKWFDMVQLNLRATFNTCRLGIKSMREFGGNIITLGSAIGHHGTESNSAYAVSKAASWSLTQCLSKEAQKYRINVNEIIPGPVKTEMNPGATGLIWKEPQDVTALALLIAEQNLDNGATGQSFSLKRG